MKWGITGLLASLLPWVIVALTHFGIICAG